MYKPNHYIADRIQIDLKVLAREVVAKQYEQHPELWDRYGKAGYEKCVQDTEAHLAYLAEAIEYSSISLFTEYIDWARDLLLAFNVPPDDLAANLEATRIVLTERLPASDVPLAVDYLNAGIGHLSNEPVIVNSFIDPAAPLGLHAHTYLHALLNGKTTDASRTVFEAVEAGANVGDVYQFILQPAQREIGRLWQTNVISVAHEHFCTAATQRIMAQLHPHIKSAPRIGRTLVGACVSGELHDIGMRMVTDTFEMAGWDTVYVGANTPVRSLVQLLGEQKPDVLALSATITYHLGKVREIINSVRAEPSLERVKIIVGGYPFNVSPRLWQEIGADGYAPDSSHAVQIAGQLVSEA